MQIRGLDRTVTSQVNNWPLGWGKSQPWEQLNEKVIKLVSKQLFGATYLVIQTEREMTRWPLDKKVIKLTANNYLGEHIWWYSQRERDDTTSQPLSVPFLFCASGFSGPSRLGYFPNPLAFGSVFQNRRDPVLAGSASLMRKCCSRPKSPVPVCY